MDAVFGSLDTKVMTMGFTDDLLYPDDLVKAVGERFKYHKHFFVPDNVKTMVSCLILMIEDLIYIIS